MTKGAVPLPQSPDRRFLDSPARRKRRRLETTPSDASSRNEPISPQGCFISTPSTMAKRIRTPMSEGSRRLRPTLLQRNPLMPLDPNRNFVVERAPFPRLAPKQSKTVSEPHTSVLCLVLTITECSTGMGAEGTGGSALKISQRLD